MPVPCGIGAGERGSLLAGITPRPPSVSGTGEGEQTQSGAGSRCTAGRVRGQSPPGSPAQTGSRGVPQGRSTPNRGVPGSWVSRDAEEEGCTGGHRHWVALPRGRDAD